MTQITTHLQNLTALQNLDLDQNQIEDMSMEAFSGTKNLKTLRLQGNRLTELPFMSSRSIILERLTHIDVSDNKLENLKNFIAAPKLEDLRMSGNG